MRTVEITFQENCKQLKSFQPFT